MSHLSQCMRFQQCGILTCVDLDEPLQPPFKLRHSKWCSVRSYNHRILKRLAKALIRLRVCAGWSEAMLVAHTTLLEISCTGSYFDKREASVCILMQYNIKLMYTFGTISFKITCMLLLNDEYLQTWYWSAFLITENWL